MTQLTINIENEALLPILKKLLKELNGVSLAHIKKKSDKKSMLERSLTEASNGDISGPFHSTDDLMKHLAQ